MAIVETTIGRVPVTSETASLIGSDRNPVVRPPYAELVNAAVTNRETQQKHHKLDWIQR